MVKLGSHLVLIFMLLSVMLTPKMSIKINIYKRKLNWGSCKALQLCSSIKKEAVRIEIYCLSVLTCFSRCNIQIPNEQKKHPRGAGTLMWVHTKYCEIKDFWRAHRLKSGFSQHTRLPCSGYPSRLTEQMQKLMEQ